MKSNFRINLYHFLSKDKRIYRFRKFHQEEERTILLFLMQVGYEKEKMINKFKELLCLHRNICIKDAFISYMKTNQKNKHIEEDIKTQKREIKKYNKLKKTILRYLSEIDLTENKQIVIAFETLILYEATLQKLYEDEAKDEEKVRKLTESVNL